MTVSTWTVPPNSVSPPAPAVRVVERRRLLVTAAVRAGRAPADDPAPVVEGLTERELEVLSYLSAFFTTDEIAAQLFVSVNTVKTHVRHILRKLAVSNRSQAVRRAWALNLI